MSFETFVRHVFAGAVLFAFALPATAAETCTIIADVQTKEIIVREGVCDRRAPPQSTFKLPLAVMGFDAGVLKDAHTPRWDYQTGFTAFRDVEKKPHDPTSWEAVSVVWYSQEITHQLGAQRFADYVRTFSYGNGDVSGDPGKSNGLSRSWLSSSLQISPDEQIAFLLKLRHRSLGVSAHAYEKTQEIIPDFEAGDWRVKGKTGAGWLRGKDGELDRMRPVGWFIGWAQREGREIVFARLLLENRRLERPVSFIARDDFLADLPALVK